MLRQTHNSNISRIKLDHCVSRESDSDTHTLDVFGLSSSMAAYAWEIGRDASRRIRSRRALARA